MRRRCFFVFSPIRIIFGFAKVFFFSRLRKAALLWLTEMSRSNPRLIYVWVPTFLFLMSVYIAGPLVSQVIIKIERDFIHSGQDTPITDDDAAIGNAATISFYASLAQTLPAIVLAGSYGRNFYPFYESSIDNI